MSTRMGTVALHQLGDISREQASYFTYDREDADNYYGSWVYGFGFFNVSFPKHTTREMTEDERATLENQGVVIA